MKRPISEIVAEIETLLDELTSFDVGDSSSNKDIRIVKKVPKKTAGCSGAVQDLIDEGFFDSQKGVSQVVDKLKEEGQPYSRELVSMNLLNLVKPPRKILRRIKEGKQWQYILRK
jgi:hypothetical protein